ncbi:MAG: LD-carboxypeptidase [Solobacterium sp.]|nr:LD-carboxypeptidase [Solobacterium sp.]
MKKENSSPVLPSLCLSLLLSACAAKPAPAEESDVFSEGDDTKITITGYQTINDPDHYFLKEGDKIAVIAPSSPPGKQKTEDTIRGLKEWGYVPVEGKYVSVEERTLENCVEDFEWALNDAEIKMIFCVRGGYGACDVMDAVGFEAIEKAKKPILGYSDIGIFLSAWTAAGLKSIHSPMRDCFINRYPKECTEAVQHIMKGEIPSYRCQGSSRDIPGAAEGILVGGNLSTMTAVLDTAYDCMNIKEPYILFLEEVGENYGHILRLLTILKHHGVLDRAAGVIFGEWTEIPAECSGYSGNSRGGKFTSASDLVQRQFFPDADIPVAYGFPAGHGEANYPLLMGEKARLEVTEDSYTIEWIPEN